MTRYPLLSLLAVILTVCCAEKDASERQTKTAGSIGQGFRVTPVRGPSWLKHLGLTASETRMGQMGGMEGPPESSRREPAIASGTNSLGNVIQRYLSILRSDSRQASQLLNETFMLSGADLYRLNCQSCHGPDGKGSPPEINSLLGPVQGASAEMIKQQMKERGVPIGDAMAQQLAAQAEADLRNRLQNGGKKMPPFRHLAGNEVEALLGYLDQLAGVPNPKRAGLLVPQSAARAGEHVMKGTCHVCHDATGPGGGHMSMMTGIIPSLASIPRQQSLSTVLHQVEYGSSGMMMMMNAQQMPALPYFTKDEIAASYFYLIDYPPGP